MLASGHVAVITGGSGGIGSAVVRAFAAAGATVVINDYGVTVDGREPSSEPATALAEEIQAAGGRASVHVGSIASWDSAEELIRGAIDEYGHIDSLVTAHGILRERMIFNLTEEDWDSVVDTHLKGTFNCVRHASAAMRERRTGSILCVTSSAGLEGNPAQANYAAAKAGIVGMTFSGALALGKYNVNVNALAPSASTRMTDRLSERSARTKKATDRGDASLSGHLAVALATDSLRHVTGQVFTAAASRLARWSHPQEVAMSQRESWNTDSVCDTVANQLGNPPLRRFGALNIPLPSADTKAFEVQ